MKNKNFAELGLKHFIEEIVSLNRGWKVARDLFGEDSEISASLRDLKNSMQIRLLRTYRDKVYLAHADDSDEEPLFSIRVDDESVARSDAEHLPVRVATEYFSDEEINQLLREQ